MKRIKLKVLMVGVLFFALAGCTEGTPSADAGSKEKTGSNRYGIELVDGKKWKVNEEMMVHIRSMENDLLVKLEGPNAYAALGDRLNERLSALTSSCTMKGKSHEELHKWLLPLFDLVEALRETKTMEEGKARYAAVKASMDEFNTYFE